MVRASLGVLIWIFVVLVSGVQARLEPRDILMTLGNMEYASWSNIPDGWYEIGSKGFSYTVGLDSSTASQGQSSLYFTCDPVAEYTSWGIRLPTGIGRNGLKRGDRLTLTADVRTGEMNRAKVILVVDALRADGTASARSQVEVSIPNLPWHGVRVDLTVPEDAALVGVSIMAGISAGGRAQFWVDNVRLTNGEQIEVPVRSTRTIPTFTYFRLHPDVYESARRYDKVILAPQNWLYARPLRYYNPNIEVYVHFSAVSTISTQEGQWDPLDYSWVNQNRPQWFLTDSSGVRIQERYYPGAYLVDIGNVELQQRWAERTVRFALRCGFTGVSMDNVVKGFLYDNTSTCSQYASNDAYHEAMTRFLQEVTTRIHQAGLKAGANFGYVWTASEYPYSAWMNYVDMALSENWVRWWSLRLQSYGMVSVPMQIEHLLALDNQGDKLSLIQGRATETEVEIRRYLYGFALLNYNSRTCFQTANAGYTEIPHYLNDYELALGTPVERYTLIAGDLSNGGLLRRRFTRGLVVVNTHPSQAFAVTLDDSYIDADGKHYPPGAYNLPAQRALILAKPANHLEITTRQSVTNPKPGEQVIITVNVRNTSAQVLRSVWLRVPVAPNLRYMAGSASHGGMYDPTWRVVVWVIDELPAGASVERSFSVRVE
ncbi:MAG: putative glycoside hydrolase [Armatimonadota bacterium]